jgi:UDP-3-O-[3-hydroxymyristoyl] glucosamine N-acyltransferase
VQLGRGCVIAAQTGIAGSTTLGDNVHVGGQVGIAQHLTIGDNVRIAAKSGVMNDLAPDATYGASIADGSVGCRARLLTFDGCPGRHAGGSPAVPVMEFRRQMVHLKQAGKK